MTLHQSRIHEVLSGLTFAQRVVLYTLSIAYEPLSLSQLCSVLKSAKMKASTGRPFTQKALSDELERLVEAGLVEVSSPWESGYRIPVACSELIIREAIREGVLEAIAQAVRHEIPLHARYSYYRNDISARRLLRELRLALYERKLDEMDQLLLQKMYLDDVDDTHLVSRSYLFLRVFGFSFDWSFLSTFPQWVVVEALTSIIRWGMFWLQPIQEPARQAMALCAQWAEGSSQLSAGSHGPLTATGQEAGTSGGGRVQEDKFQCSMEQMEELVYELILHLVFSGKVEDAERFLNALSAVQWESSPPTMPTSLTHSEMADGLRGILAFLRGKDTTALECLSGALAAIRKRTRKRKVSLPGIAGVLHVLALVAQRDPVSLKEAVALAKVNGDDLFVQESLGLMAHLAEQGLEDQSNRQMSFALFVNPDPRMKEERYTLGAVLVAIAGHLLGMKVPKKEVHVLRGMHGVVARQGYRWLAAELESILRSMKEPIAIARGATTQAGSGGETETGAAAEGAGESDRSALETVRAVGIRVVCDPDNTPPEWELSLRSLEQVAHEIDNSEQELRLTWRCDTAISPMELVIVGPFEQKRRSTGGWTRGRVVALSRLHDPQSRPAYLTAQDHRICNHITTGISCSYYSPYTHQTLFIGQAALVEMIGHPLVFLDPSPNTRLELVAGEPEVVVTPYGHGKKEGVRIELLPPQAAKASDQSLTVIQESPTRYRIFPFQKHHLQVARILGDKGLKIPAEGRDQALRVLSALSASLSVQSQVGALGEHVEEVPADPRPVVQLRRHEAGLAAAVRVRPFGPSGPAYRPGDGGATVVTLVDGCRKQVCRDLDAEWANAMNLLESCVHWPGEEDEHWSWTLDDPEQSLETLLTLEEMREQGVGVEWPEGEPIRVRSRTMDATRFHMSLQTADQWFQVVGKMRVDEELVLGMDMLLDFVAGSKSRFIPLDNGEFLALTRDFRRRLDEWNGCLQRDGKSRKILLPPTAVPVLAPLTKDLGSFKGGAAWKRLLKRMEEASRLDPQVPSTFHGELRNYQMDGFTWMARLAHLGMGACLADDMGLGKTIQALALLLLRGEKGPALVVAPTSVCANWEAESRRFAPGLNPTCLRSGDRRATLAELGPFDLLLCSYGLLQQEETGGMLAQVAWHTIILDEAQAIKNMQTKRSQAAMALQGDFKLITTGTPIENHLGELWNLFQFVVPGLLGTHDSFNSKFAVPIQKMKDRQARADLKRLITPFILRRTKTQVLDELPPRTDVVLHVEMNDQEAAMYESLRRQAIKRLNEESGPQSQRHIRILAELTRLRRYCCHPDLVVPDAGITSSKLALFGELVDELQSGQHKALVFSQFVDHLTLVRSLLDERGISYQYLDGSTSPKERQRRVALFQGGKGDFFLISLKAGGTGLNLTVADYVIHLDPWWNPAVEDQASDRAHRIGQTRPVTVYRLVTKGTVEERVVELHHQKRGLADSLLDGTDISGKMSPTDLLRMIGG